MSSSEEYLESLLQSMMNGEVAAPSTEDLKSAIATLSGEEPEQVVLEQAVADNMNENEMEAMLAEMVANLDESDEGMTSDGITDAMNSEEEALLDLSSLEMEDSFGDAMPDELGTDDILDGLALEESGMDDMALEEPGIDSIPMDEIGLDGLVLEEAGMDDIVPEVPVTDDMALEEANMDDLSLDELSLDDMLMEESETGDMELEESGMDDLSLDDLSLDDMLMEESETGDMELEESAMDDLSLDGLDDLSLTESDVDDLVLNESGSDDMLLDELGLSDMALEESDEDAFSDNLSLEEGMDDLAEIHDLLDQTNQSEEIDDEMLALLESVSDSADNSLAGEEDEFAFLQSHEEGSEAQEGAAADADAEEEPAKGRKKRKKKKRGKKNADLQDNPAELGDSVGAEAEEGESSEKKQGIFARFLAFLTETDEDEEDVNAGGEGSDENSELLAELNAEDKKAKKEKKKKEKKEKKGKKASGKEGDEEGGKAAKKKKAKKEKKEKPVDEEVTKDAGKKLSKKKVIPAILFCATILAVVLILSSIVPDYLQKRDAQVAYDMGNYDQAFDLLYGKKLNEEEEVILHKSTIILKMERKLTSYRNYQKIGNNELTALNALVQGAALYFELLPEAEQYNVTNEITAVYQEILSVLSSQYGLSETDVMYILDAGDDVLYTQLLTSIVYGISFEDDGVGEQPEALQDILPEEQEILDGMPDMATDAASDMVTDVTD